MYTPSEAPPETNLVLVGGDRLMSSYSMFKTVNLDFIEVTNSVSDSDNYAIRWVFIREGEYEAWVKVPHVEEYGYEIQPDERVSEAELEAIVLKQRAIRPGKSVSMAAVTELLEREHPDQIYHGLVALLHAAKADPTVPATEVDSIRDRLHERTGYVDTDHPPTVRRILEDVLSEGVNDDDRDGSELGERA